MNTTEHLWNIVKQTLPNDIANAIIAALVIVFFFFLSSIIPTIFISFLPINTRDKKSLKIFSDIMSIFKDIFK